MKTLVEHDLALPRFTACFGPEVMLGCGGRVDCAEPAPGARQEVGMLVF